MASLEGQTIASTYKQLLKITSEGVGADASGKYIEDGLGTDTALSLSTTRVGIGTASPSNTFHSHGLTHRFSSDSYNVVYIQSDANDDNSNDDIVLQFTTGSGNTVKGELRYDESDDRFEISAGDNQNHLTIDSSGNSTFAGNVSISSQGDGLSLSRSGYDTYSLQHSAGNGMAIFNVTDNRNEMHFKGDGNVGIGTNNPVSLLYLEEDNTTNVTDAASMISNSSLTINGNSSDGSDVIRMGAMSNATGDYFIEVSNSAGNAAYSLLLNPINGGNVGIGQTSPSASLHVSGSAILQNDSSTLNFYNTAGAQRAFLQLSGTGLIIDTDSFLEFKPNNSTAMYIESSGNVGIGETSPNSKLEVAGDITLDSGTGSSSDSEIIFKASYNPVASIKHSQFSTTYGNQATDIIAQDGAGNQVIALRVYSGTGASTKPKVHAHYDLIAGAATSSGYAVLGMIDSGAGSTRYGSIRKNYDSPFDMRIRASNTTFEAPLVFEGSSDTEYGRFDTSGNLGIGTTNPESLLHIQGASSAAVGARLTLDNNVGSALNNAVEITMLTDSGASVAGISNARIKAINTNLSNGAAALTFSTFSGSSEGERMRISSGGQLFLFNQTSGAGNATLKYTTGTGAVTYDLSSKLVKDNIEDSPYGLDEILQLQSRKYFRTDDQRNEIGLIADEVIGILPEFVPTDKKSCITGNEEDNEIIPISVNYDKIVSVLVKAVQELSAQNDALTARIEVLENA